MAKDLLLADLYERLRNGEELRGDESPFADGDHFGGMIGLTWDSFALDRVTAHVDIDERHHQPYGIVHGGVWCAIIESLASFGAALNGALVGKQTVGVSNATDFLRAHLTGRIDAVATPIHVGRSQQLWQVVLTRASDGKAVARGQVRLQSVDPAQLPAS